MAVNVVFFGPPGAGKGTQSELLAKEFGLLHVNAGGVLRDIIKGGTEQGKAISNIIDGGGMVSDETIDSIVNDYVLLNMDSIKNGMIFDGYPRSVRQAESLDLLLKRVYDTKKCLVVHLQVDKETIMKRLLNRKDGRLDDNEKAIEKRFGLFRNNVIGLIMYYMATGRLLNIDGNLPIETINQEIKKALNVTGN